MSDTDEVQFTRREKQLIADQVHTVRFDTQEFAELNEKVRKWAYAEDQ